MTLEITLISFLLGTSLTLLGESLSIWPFGVAGVAVELICGLIHPMLAFIIFPIYVLFLMVYAGGNEPASPTYIITAISGPLTGKRYILSSRHASLEFGREDCEVLFPPDATSIGRHHCKVYLDSGKPYIVDNGSRNGTFILSPFYRLEAGRPIALPSDASFCLARNDIVFKLNIK